MAAFDVDAALRWFRFDHKISLARRADDALPFLPVDGVGRQVLLFDTCVYIDQLQMRMPSDVTEAILLSEINHSSVAIQELSHSIGALDPRDGRTARAISGIAAMIRSMQPHRTFAPDTDTLGRAALLAGLICRLQGCAGDGRLRALQDCTLFLQARKLGLTVLTRNIRDFDILLQLIPSGRVLLYRSA